MTEINRPGLELGGFYENFAWQRIQIFGRGENAFLQKLATEKRTGALETLFTYAIPCCVFTHSLEPTADFLAIAEKAECPLLQTSLSSSEFTMRILRVLSTIFAPKQTVHGILVEVFGIGVLLQGDSGVGKSESALSLIERGHRLIADDAVEIRRVSGNILMGTGAQVVSHHMEIRGLGIINITHLFGVGAIRDKKQIQLVVQLEVWDQTKNYDRIGAEENTVDILGVHVPAGDRADQARAQHPRHHRDGGAQREAEEDGLLLGQGVQQERDELAGNREHAGNLPEREMRRDGRANRHDHGTARACTPVPRRCW